MRENSDACFNRLIGDACSDCNKLVEAYDGFVKSEFADLESVPFNSHASVGYAHTVNHRERRLKAGASLADLVRKNQRTHQGRIETRIRELNIASNVLWFAAAFNTALYTYVTGLAYSQMKSGKIAPEEFIDTTLYGAKGVAIIYSLAFLGSNIDRIVKRIRRAYNHLFHKETA